MKFNSGEFAENAKTVGEVILLLSQLDKDTPCHQGFSKSVDIAIMNSGSSSPHVDFCDGGDWVDIDEDE